MNNRSVLRVPTPESDTAPISGGPAMCPSPIQPSYRSAISGNPASIAPTAAAEPFAAAHRASFIERADGTSLFYKDWGAGRPVLFVHSWGMQSDMWAYQMLPLTAAGLRCVAYDRRSHGRSSDPGRGYEFDTLADDLAAVIQMLDLRDVTLVGHSMGCSEIVRYITRHGSDRVARIALISPALPFLLKTPDNPHGIDRSLFESVREQFASDYPKWLADNAPPFFVPETSAEMRQWTIDLMLKTSLKAIIDCNVSVTETDFRAELPRLAVPALVIHGTADVSAPFDLCGQPTARLIPGSTLKVYEGAPHGLFITHMARLNDDLLRFITGTVPG